MNSTEKTGILLINLGTPDAPTKKAVYRYLKEFLLDKRVIDIPWLPRNLLVRGIIAPLRSGIIPIQKETSTDLYKMLWTEKGSPLKVYGEELTAGVQQLLGDEFIVKLAMRYQNPSIESVVDELLKENLKEILVFPLFPQYASATTGSVHEEVMRVIGQKQNIPNIQFINSYYDNEKMIDVFVKNAQQFDINSYDHILFSYHGLPKRQIEKADDCNYCLKEGCCNSITAQNKYCYSAQCYATTRAIAKKLNLHENQYTTCFQSRLGKDPWVEPYTSDVIEEQAHKGTKSLLVFCPAFVADCLETTIEITVEYKEEFEELGGERLDLVPGLNADPDWMNAVKEMVLEYM